MSSFVPVEESFPPVPESGSELEPPRSGRWLYLLSLVVSFVGLQFALVLGFLFLMVGTGAIQRSELDAYLESESGILISVVLVGVSGLATILLAFVWPFLWKVFGGQPFSLGEWLGWTKPRFVPVIAAFIVSPIILTGISIPIVMIFGNADVDAQLDMFSTPMLQVVAGIMAVLVAPIAEEALFRGALYNALLARSDQRAENDQQVGWTRHILPILVVTVAFAAMHLLAGFERMGSIILILALSLYLTLLRTLTGSIRTTVAAHMAWNGLAVIAIIAEKMGYLQ